MGLRILMMKLAELGLEVGRVQGLTDQQEIHHMKRRIGCDPDLLLRLKLRVHA
jgi:hypothetical protein